MKGKKNQTPDRGSAAIMATWKSAGVALRGESDELPEVQNNGISDPNTV